MCGRKFLLPLIAFVGICSLSRCGTNSDGPEILVFDNEKPVMIPVDDFSRIELNGSRIGLIKDVYLLGGSYLIYTQNALYLYSRGGQFQSLVSNVGRARGEYLTVYDVWTTDDSFFAYDINGKKILRFDYNGNFLAERPLLEKVSDPFQMLFPIGRSGYVGKCMYRGMDGLPELAYYDENFNYVGNIGGDDLSLKSGIKLNRPFAFCSDTSVLYSPIFDVRIFEVTRTRAMVKYNIDFGKQKLSIGDKDEYEILDGLNKTNKKYSTLFSNMEMTDSYFAFSFLCRNERRVGVYDFEKGKTSVISIELRSEEEVVSFVKTFKNELWVFTQDQVNTYMYVVPDMLAKASGRD